ncbi:MAG: glycosyltransferase [Coleofasciculus sp. G1-WW12-02]|uniref:glycosyltransferase n=1 Tax=Coleofasciculus sp. G1-WW12-02 TaxID=3068483 RepID=UPI0032FDA8E8
MLKISPHVAFYLHGLYGGGAERVIVNLANSFVHQGLKVDIVLNYKRGPYLSDVSPKVRIVDLKSSRLRDGVGLPQLMHYLRQEQPAGLLATTHYSNERAVLAKRLTRVATKVVVREANTLSVEAQHDVELRWRFKSLAARLTYPWTDGIIAVSKGVATDLSQMTGLSLNRIQVIYNPTITPLILARAKEPLEHPWFTSGQPPVILGIGRLTKQKDFPTLIRAFAKVRQVRPAKLMILGEVRDTPDPQITTLIDELDLDADVALPGFQKNPYPYIAQAAVFVSSSIWEGLSNTLIEAMALGTPVVATDCPSGSAEILDNGKYGYLVPVGDSNEMAQAILKVLSGDAKSVDSGWLEQFTLETVTQQYIDALGVALQVSNTL